MEDIKQELLSILKTIEPKATEKEVDELLSVATDKMMPPLLMAKVGLMLAEKVGLLKAVAQVHRSLYKSYVEAGFTDKEAFELVKGYGNPVSPKESK